MSAYCVKLNSMLYIVIQPGPPVFSRMQTQQRSNAGTKKDVQKRYYDSSVLADKVFHSFAVTGKFWPEVAGLDLNHVIRLDSTIVEP